MMKEENIVLETPAGFVYRQRDGYNVFVNRGLHAEGDSKYPPTADGKSLAEYRLRYITKRAEEKK